MLSILIEGTLLTTPSQRTSAKGQPYTVAQVRCTADDGESVFCSVIAFSASAAEALAQLGAGDTVAIAGPAALSQWEKDGEHKVGLKVTATRVLSVYDAGMRRRAASQQREQEREPQGGGQDDRPGRGQYGQRNDAARRDMPREQPRPRFDDGDDGGPV